MLGLSCGIWDLVPWPGIEPEPPALGVWHLNHWTTREVLHCLLFEATFPKLGRKEALTSLHIPAWVLLSQSFLQVLTFTGSHLVGCTRSLLEDPPQVGEVGLCFWRKTEIKGMFLMASHPPSPLFTLCHNASTPSTTYSFVTLNLDSITSHCPLHHYLSPGLRKQATGWLILWVNLVGYGFRHQSKCCWEGTIYNTYFIYRAF